MQIYKRNGCASAVLALDGEVDAFKREALLTETEALIEGGVRHLVVNLRRVRFINTSGLGALIQIHRQLEQLGGRLIVSQPTDPVWQPIELLGLDRVLSVRHRRRGPGADRRELAPAWNCQAKIARAG